MAFDLPSAPRTSKPTQAQSIPSQHKSLVFHSTSEPLQVTTQPVPQVTSGSAIVEVIASEVLSYSKDVYNGTRKYPYPVPYTPGIDAVGRIVAVGNDATTLAPGDLVMTVLFIRGRDDPEALCLQGLSEGFREASAKLVQEEFRNGAYAKYMRVPLENCTKLPDDGRNPIDWLNLSRMLVSYGGLTSEGGLDLRPGEIVAVAPATGQFGGSGVEVALAMGAKVIALGRSAEGLQKLQQGLSEYGSRLKTVQITGDVEKDAKAVGPIDCYLDISPPEAAKSTHILSCFQALKPRGRMCIMGNIDHQLPYWKMLSQNITVTGKFMYEANAARKMVQMVEIGILNLTRYTSKSFALEEWDKAFDHAKENMRWGQVTVISPGSS